MIYSGGGRRKGCHAAADGRVEEGTLKEGRKDCIKEFSTTDASVGFEFGHCETSSHLFFGLAKAWVYQSNIFLESRMGKDSSPLLPNVCDPHPAAEQ